MRNVESFYIQMISQITADLENVKCVCVTADCWSVFHRYIYSKQMLFSYGYYVFLITFFFLKIIHWLHGSLA